jgi:hypothetical protein
MRKLAIHVCVDPVTPRWSRLCISLRRGTVSNAMLKSRIAASVWNPRSYDLRMPSTVVRSCVPQEWPDLNPWFSSNRRRLLSRCVRACRHTMFTRHGCQRFQPIVHWLMLATIFEDTRDVSFPPVARQLTLVQGYLEDVTLHSAGAMFSAQRFRVMFEMQSEPAALDGLISSSNLQTPVIVTRKEVIGSHGFLPHSGIGDPSLAVNTDLNWLMRSLAMDLVLLTSLPWSLRGDALMLSCFRNLMTHGT